MNVNIEMMRNVFVNKCTPITGVHLFTLYMKIEKKLRIYIIIYNGNIALHSREYV